MERQHVDRLDGLRAIAVLAVIIEHFGPHRLAFFSWGALGVDIFFFLSGFLITGILLDCREADGSAALDPGWSLRSFYARRFLRIFPLYYAFLAVAAFCHFRETRETLGWTLSYTTNIYIAIHHRFPEGIAHFWTLAVEEQFYIAWPLLVLMAPKRALAGLFVIAFAIGALSRPLVMATTHNRFAAFCLTTSSLDSLAGGAIMALMTRDRFGLTELRGGLSRLCLWIGVPLAAVFFISRAHDRIGSAAEIGVPLVCFWVFDRLLSDPSAFAILRSKPLVYIGRISYGVYVLHMAAGELLRDCPYALVRGRLLALFVAAASIGAASISFWPFEHPINRLKRFFPYRRDGGAG